MIIFKPSRCEEEDLPLTWRNYVHKGKVLGEISPILVDPNGHYLTIHKHVIDPDGTVHGPPGQTNSVKCPICGWDDMVKLEGWQSQR